MDFNASKNVLCPCKGCADRFCACSSTCEKYAEYRKAIFDIAGVKEIQHG